MNKNDLGKSKLMQCGHTWLPKRGLKTKGMCLNCYKSYLLRLGEGRNERMERVQRNVGFVNMTAANKETQLMAFFDAVMPEIPLYRAIELSKEIAQNSK